MPGWKTPTTNVKTFDDLPKQAQDYVKVRIVSLLKDCITKCYRQFIENFIGVKVRLQSKGFFGTF